MPMNVFQTSSGYRDPQKAMTLKALEARAKAAQEASAQSLQPTAVANPLQGIAGLLGTMGAGIQQGRAESELGRGRADLASIMSGVNMDTGPNMQDIARIGQYDPELAQRMYEQAMETRQANLSREDTQAFQAGESALERQQRLELEQKQQEFTHGENVLSRTSTETQNDLNRQAQAALQRQQDAAAAGRQEDQQQAAEDLARIQSQLDIERKKGELGAETANIAPETGAREAEAKRLNLKPGTPEYNEYVLTGKYPTPGATTNIYSGSPGGEYAKKAEQVAAERHGKIVEQGNTARGFVADIKRLGELGQTIGTGKEEELKVQFGPYAEMLGIDISGLGEAQAFQAIADKMAPTMRPEGSGSSSNYDAQQFLRSLPNLGRNPEGNKIIQATFEAIMQDRMNAAAVAQRALLSPDDPNYLDWKRVDAAIAALPDPFQLYKDFIKGSGTGTGGTDTGGGGGQFKIRRK